MTNIKIDNILLILVFCLQLSAGNFNQKMASGGIDPHISENVDSISMDRLIFNLITQNKNEEFFRVISTGRINPAIYFGSLL
jgi:hypothetical protein